MVEREPVETHEKATLLLSLGSGRYEVTVGVGAEPVVRSVRFTNVPSYLHAEGLIMRPRGVRLFGAAAERKGLSVQLAFGGAYYGIVDVAELGMRVVPEQIEQLAEGLVGLGLVGGHGDLDLEELADNAWVDAQCGPGATTAS